MPPAPSLDDLTADHAQGDVRPHDASKGPLVVYADGVRSPRSDPVAVMTAARLSGRPRVLLGWTVDKLPWLGSCGLEVRTTMGGFALAGHIAAGRVSALPIRLSAVPALFARERPDVCVVSGVRRGSGFAYSTAVALGPSAVRNARRVIVEVDEAAADIGAPLIEGEITGVITRPDDSSAVVSREIDAVDLAIGRNVVSLLPDRPTLQFGPGGIGEAIARSIDRPVGIWSGLLTEAMAELASRALLRGVATAAYTWGGDAVVDLAREGRLRLVPVEESHDPQRIADQPDFMACNTALQVDLDGSVNVECVDGRNVTSLGGHADFCLGASRAPGGTSVIALRSTTRRGHPTIVPRVELTSTPRSDIHVVVTEHGIADLRGVSEHERRRRIASVAAPEHRDALASSLRQ